MPVTKEFLLERMSVNERGCWNWTGRTRRNGYGSITIDYKNRSVHKVAFEMWSGSIPTGSLVCHECDNRKCFNPDHLFLGTQKVNMRDAAAKGRLSWKREKERLLPQEILEAILNSNDPWETICEKYAVSRSSVYAIRKAAKAERTLLP